MAPPTRPVKVLSACAEVGQGEAVGEQGGDVDAAVDDQGERLLGGVGVGAAAADLNLVQHQAPHRHRGVLGRQADGRDYAALGGQLARLAERLTVVPAHSTTWEAPRPPVRWRTSATTSALR